MTDLRKAAEMALEALKQTPTANKLFDEPSYEAQKEAIEALRQALAQPKYQTVSAPQPQTFTGQNPYTADDITAVVEAIVTAFKLKREWIGLTDEDIATELTKEFRQWWSRHISVCRAIERKLKEKNT